MGKGSGNHCVHYMHLKATFNLRTNVQIILTWLTMTSINAGLVPVYSLAQMLL